MNCEYGVIQITSAFWGAAIKDACIPQARECPPVSVLADVNAICGAAPNTAESCDVLAAGTSFSGVADPCVGMNKYLDVSYLCVTATGTYTADTVSTATLELDTAYSFDVDQTTDLDIGPCPEGSGIKINDAIFSSADDSCAEVDATSYFQGRCGDDSSCSATVNGMQLAAWSGSSCSIPQGTLSGSYTCMSL